MVHLGQYPSRRAARWKAGSCFCWWWDHHALWACIFKTICSTANEKLDKYNDDTGKYDQTVFINGESVSTLSTSKLLLSSYTNIISFPCWLSFQVLARHKAGALLSNVRMMRAKVPLQHTVSYQLHIATSICCFTFKDTNSLQNISILQSSWTLPILPSPEPWVSTRLPLLGWRQLITRSTRWKPSRSSPTLTTCEHHVQRCIFAYNLGICCDHSSNGSTIVNINLWQEVLLPALLVAPTK